MDLMGPWDRGNGLFGDSQEKGCQVGADLLPPERYQRVRARPPVMQASRGLSICFSSDRQRVVSPETGEVGMFLTVTWGSSLEKLQGTRGVRGKNGSTQSPGHRRGEDWCHSLPVTTRRGYPWYSAFSTSDERGGFSVQVTVKSSVFREIDTEGMWPVSR